MWCIKGRIVPIASDHSVAPSDRSDLRRAGLDRRRRHRRRGDPGRAAGPAGSAARAVVDVGSSLVMPGLVDLHNHLAYNTLPLWTEPTRTTPWPHHNAWTRAPSYARVARPGRRTR